MRTASATMAAADGSLGVLLLMFCSPDEIACKTNSHSDGQHELTLVAPWKLGPFFQEAAFGKATLQIAHLPSYQTAGSSMMP